MSFILELWAFMRARKKFWLLPILVMMAILGALIVLAQGSAVAYRFPSTVILCVGARRQTQHQNKDEHIYPRDHFQTRNMNSSGFSNAFTRGGQSVR